MGHEAKAPTGAVRTWKVDDETIAILRRSEHVTALGAHVFDDLIAARAELAKADEQYVWACELSNAKYDDWKKACDERDSARAGAQREAERARMFAADANACAAERNANAAERDKYRELHRMECATSLRLMKDYDAARADADSEKAGRRAIDVVAKKLEDSLREVLRTAEEVFKTPPDSLLAEGVGADWNAAVATAKTLLSHPQSDAVADGDREAHRTLRVNPGSARIAARSTFEGDEVHIDLGSRVDSGSKLTDKHPGLAESAPLAAKLECAQERAADLERSLAALRATRVTIDKRLHAARERIRELEAKLPNASPNRAQISFVKETEFSTTPPAATRLVQLDRDASVTTDAQSFVSIEDANPTRVLKVWRNGVEYVPAGSPIPLTEAERRTFDGLIQVIGSQRLGGLNFAESCVDCAKRIVAERDDLAKKLNAMCDTIEQVRLKHETTSEALDRIVGDSIKMADLLAPEAKRRHDLGFTTRGNGSGVETLLDVLERVLNDYEFVRKHAIEVSKEVRTLRAENSKLRDEVKKHRDSLQEMAAQLAKRVYPNVMQCAFCAIQTSAPSGEIERLAREHIKTCEKHPLRDAEKEIKRLRRDIIAFLYTHPARPASADAIAHSEDARDYYAHAPFPPRGDAGPTQSEGAPKS